MPSYVRRGLGTSQGSLTIIISLYLVDECPQLRIDNRRYGPSLWRHSAMETVMHQYTYHIYVKSLLYGLSIDIKHIKIPLTDTKRAKSKFEKLKFLIYFLNKDFSLNISLKRLKFSVHVHKGHLEGSVSGIFYLGPSFYFM